MSQSRDGEGDAHGDELRMVEIVYPDDTNSMGTLFGGRALWLMDRLAFLVASRHARMPIVTACSEKVEFRAPVKEGDLIELRGRIGHVGRSSIRVDIDMYAENLLTGCRILCTTGSFVMVAVDEKGRPVPVPPTQGEQAADAHDEGATPGRNDA